MRVCFLGISQNLPSYARRVCRRLIKHHRDLLNGQEFFESLVTDKALFDAKRASGVSNVRKRQIETILKDTSAYEAATEVSDMTGSSKVIVSIRVTRCALIIVLLLCRRLLSSNLAEEVAPFHRETFSQAKP